MAYEYINTYNIIQYTYTGADTGNLEGGGSDMNNQ